MFDILTFGVALTILGLAHVFIVIQLEPSSRGVFWVPPIWLAAALDVLALLLMYWI